MIFAPYLLITFMIFCVIGVTSLAFFNPVNTSFPVLNTKIVLFGCGIRYINPGKVSGLYSVLLSLIAILFKSIKFSISNRTLATIFTILYVGFGIVVLMDW